MATGGLPVHRTKLRLRPSSAVQISLVEREFDAVSFGDGEAEERFRRKEPRHVYGSRAHPEPQPQARALVVVGLSSVSRGAGFRAVLASGTSARQ